MQKERRKELETVKPRVYVDTNILQGAISGRSTEDIVFISKAKEKD
jgi:hypothetical protein